MLIWYLSNRQTTRHAIQARMTSQVVNILGIYDLYSVCFGIDVCDVKRPKASHNATNGSMVTDSLLQSHLTGLEAIKLVLVQI